MSKQLAEWSPGLRIDWFPEGVPITGLTPGCTVLVDHGNDVDHVIGFGQWLRFKLWNRRKHPDWKSYTWCRHTAVGVRQGRRIVIAEMGGRGYELADPAKYVAHLVAVVHYVREASFDLAAESMALSFGPDSATGVKGVRYGWASIPFVAFSILTGVAISVNLGRRIICSVHAGMSMVAGGIRLDRLPTDMLPCDVARTVGAARV